MDRAGVIGVVLMSVGASAMLMSAFVLMDPIWLIQLITGLVIFIFGAGLYVVYAIRVLQDVIGENITVRDQSTSR